VGKGIENARETIALGKLTASEAEVAAAAKAALSAMSSWLSGAYDTPVGERGIFIPA
jgi:ABC-type multidrug transport system fused ATPase/permease subunit